jgi:hypothetical protein
LFIVISTGYASHQNAEISSLGGTLPAFVLTP